MENMKTKVIILAASLAAIPIFLTIIFRVITSGLPKEDLLYINLLSIVTGILIFIGWIISLIVIIKSYNKEVFEEIADKNKDCFKGIANEIRGCLFDDRLQAVHRWIVKDTDLSENYETKVEEGKAIVVATPTFRNDYPHEGIKSTGDEYAKSVSENLKNKIKYRYITSDDIAKIHFDELIKFHRKTSKIKPGDIKAIVTSIPIINEIVYYPLDKPAAFSIITTEEYKPYKIAEYNVKMSTNEELIRFKSLIKYLFNLDEVKIWGFGEEGRIIKGSITEEERVEFFNLTGIDCQKI